MQQKYLIFIGVVVLAVLAGNFAYPDYFNKGADFLNQKFNLSIPHFWTKSFIFGLDLQGGVNLAYQADLNNVTDKSGAMQGLRDVIERRVNLFGVTEPVVQIQGQDRLIVELPGITNVQDAIRMIGETPYLEFLEQRTEAETQQIIDKIREVQEVQEKNEDISKVTDWQLVLQNPYFKPTELTGKYLSKVNVVFDQTTYKPQIEIIFNKEGEKLFE
ncbi:MAG: protein translocase subunit SecD, partial [Candidatus Staskawiczbacteria bacterium]|nr:protein translocase subunit SecD [Candidatus Staskawiczbacteria bacterium]